MRKRNPFAALDSQQARTVFLGAIVVLVGGATAWTVIVLVLSLVGGWLTILTAAALGVVVYLKQQTINKKEYRIANGQCANCGYDLHATPTLCPECGRDATLDEPAWRRLRRHYEAEANRDTQLPAPQAPIVAENEP